MSQLKRRPKLYTLFLLSAAVVMTLALGACAGAATPEVTSAPPATDVPAMTEAPTDVPAMTEAPTDVPTAVPATTEAPTAAPATTEAPAATAEATAADTFTIAGCTVAGFDATAMIAAGEDLYATTCAGCHGDQGQGQGNFPSLLGDDLAKDPAEVARKFVNLEHHPFMANMSADQLAAVLSYARQAFGNNASVICPEDLTSLLP